MDKAKPYLNLKDYSVSGEPFQLLHNEVYDMLETYPQPLESQLSKYYQSEDYISHTDAKRNWFEKAYHIIKSIALKNKLKLINSLNTSEKHLLDVGCGTGDFLKIASAHNWNVSGTEPNPEARALANQKTNNSVFDSDQLEKFKNSSFNVITLWHVLEHLPNLKDHLNTLSSLLKSDGKLLIAVPNFKSYDAFYYKKHWAAFDVPRHLWHFSQDSISKLVEECGMSVVETRPMPFDAFYVALLSEKYKRGYMNPLYAFWIGLKSNMKAKRTGEYSSLIYIIENTKNAK